mgnify:CR=1 FL=1
MKKFLTVGTALGMTALAVIVAAPSHADPADNSFINSLGDAGLPVPDVADPAALGQSVCPMLAQPGQHVADAAAKVADASGMSLGPATMFTGIAISTFCPGVVSAIGDGRSPLPLGLLGLG